MLFVHLISVMKNGLFLYVAVNFFPINKPFKIKVGDLIGKNLQHNSGKSVSFL